MKTLIRIAVVSFVVASPGMLEGQGTLYLSNVGEATGSSIAVGGNTVIAARFFTGNAVGGYMLDSVQLLTSSAAGNPSGFSIALYAGSRFPGSSLGSLTGFDPTAGGVSTYSASDMTLLSSASYWLVATATSPIGDGAFRWDVASTSNYSSVDGWLKGALYYTSTDAVNWDEGGFGPLQFAVYATPIPEPSSGLLLLIGGIAFATHQVRWESQLHSCIRRRNPHLPP